MDPEDPRAPYLKIADEIRDELRRGVFEQGDKLPSARDYAERFGVVTNTVQAAIKVLKSEGLVYSVTGRGTFLRARPSENDQAPAPEATGPTPEFVAIMQQLDAMNRELRGLSDRVSEIESLVKPDETQAR